MTSDFQPVRVARFSTTAALAIAFSCMPAAFAARESVPKAADAPDLKDLKAVSQLGLSFNMPGNWSVIQTTKDKDGGVSMYIEAKRTQAESVVFDASVLVYPRNTAPSLKRMAELAIDQQKGGSKSYGEAVITPHKLDGASEALTARYTNNLLGGDSPYGQQFGLYALKSCGATWVCFAYSQTLQLNESVAKAGLAKIMENITYRSSGFKGGQ